MVARPALSARLDSDFQVALVSAPAGYGKTETLASWARTVEEPVAWLSCDGSDVDPTRFMTCLLSAISASWPGAADDAFVLLERDSTNTYEAAIAVGNELAGVDGRGVIVVDDLHLAAPDPTVLSGFIGALPDHVRFVTGTRSDPPLSLGRLRVRGELLELRSDTLRFDESELADFFGAHDVTLTAEELGRVHALTEGWPAGLQLVAIALQRRGKRADFLDAFSRTDRSVGDFLLTEVLAGLPAEVTEFLLATAVLESFDAELCAQVTGVEDAGIMLDRLIAANLFVVPLDDQARRYRYHHLFGAFLRARLASLGSAGLRAAHDRAGRALEAQGDTSGALQHALAIGDAARIGEIVQGAVVHAMSLADGSGAAVQAIRLWLRHHGETAVERDPTQVVEFLVGLISLGDADQARRWLELVVQAHPGADGVLGALIESTWAEYRHHRGEASAAVSHHEAAMAAVDGRPPAHGLISLLHTALARAHLQSGDLPRAAGVLEHALAHPVGTRVPDDVRNPALAALVAARMGDLSRADELAGQAVRAADEMALGPHEPGRIFAGLACAEVLIERHDAEAAHVLDGVKRASEGTHRLTLLTPVALAEARLARVFGDEATAAGLLAHARVLHEAPDATLLGVLDEEAAQQALRFSPSRAATVIDRLPTDGAATRVLRARLALHHRDHHAARALLAGLPEPFSRRDTVERHVLSALSVLDHDVDAANDQLGKALVLAQSEGLVRAVIDVGPDVHRLLMSYPAGPREAPYIEHLLAIARRAVAPRRADVATSLVEPLSGRELTVLRYLCSRLTYHEMASALYVSPNTLKSHVRAVYRKLGVASRADAVASGRDHGLI